MAVIWDAWSNIERIQKAEQNSPSMKSGERGPPVHLLQAALIMNDCDVPHHGVSNVLGVDASQNAMFLTETATAVRAAEQRFNLDNDVGIAGKQVIGRIDTINAGFYRANQGNFGAALALQDAPFAGLKVARSIQAITLLQGQLAGLNVTGNPLLPLNVAQDALRTHFRLLAPGVVADGIARAATVADLTQIINTYQRIAGLISNAAAAFFDGIPTTGVPNPAEAVPNSGRVMFGPYYRGFSADQPIRPRDAGSPGAQFPFGHKIGPNSRAAIVIHEGTHAVDASLTSGNANVHISEFDPAYDRQPANLSLFNPSSYAGFAAHVFNLGDPNPRFGLGDGQEL
jgi:peptidoglycan hydrolase-like protein with peptidoglycan-binding domain